MHDYEIRIVTAAYRNALVFSSSQPNDLAAIRRAQSLMRPGQGVEVWRDGDCIYANHRDQPLIAPLDPPIAVESLNMDYEIRILRHDRRLSLIWNGTYMGDPQAIRAGMRVASGYPLEIWRDMECIYRAG